MGNRSKYIPKTKSSQKVAAQQAHNELMEQMLKSFRERKKPETNNITIGPSRNLILGQLRKKFAINSYKEIFHIKQDKLSTEHPEKDCNTLSNIILKILKEKTKD